MEIGRVIGNIWATKKDERISGQKLLVIHMSKAQNLKTGAMTVAVDRIGAGVGDFVLVCYGNSARLAAEDKNIPIDAAVVGIIDSLDVPGLDGWQDVFSEI